MFILTKIPPISEHSFASDIFSKPELEHNEQHDELCSNFFLEENHH